MHLDLPHGQVWMVDTEFRALNGGRPELVCMVAREYRSGTTLRLWQDELRACPRPPFPIGPDSLFVAYNAAAELGCFLQLGWPVPVRILDLYVELRLYSNGDASRLPFNSYKLPHALATFGLDGISVTEKQDMIDLILRGEPRSVSERRAILDYCTTDVDALERLLPRMLPTIEHLGQALYRGRYMAAVAAMVHTGIPIDVDLYTRLKASWPTIREQLVTEVDRHYGVYEGQSFRADRFARWLNAHNIPWPPHENGKHLALDQDTFRDMAKLYPVLGPLRELRASLSQLRLDAIQVASDGRNRASLFPFGTVTGRNKPSSNEFIFGPAVWVRGLIRPGPGRALAYIDWEQQEFAIGAALSGDPNMLAAYASGDPYLDFARRARAVPTGATKATHGVERERYKVATLAIQYGMEAPSLAPRIGQLEIVARNILREHREVFREFWRWSDSNADRFSLCNELQTVFGWRVRNGPGKEGQYRREPSVRNFLVQATGAEIMRLAACLMTEAGIQVNAPIHDAFLVEADIADIDEVVRASQTFMAKASKIVLGLELRSDAKIIRYPERYADPRGACMWETVMRLLGTI